MKKILTSLLGLIALTLVTFTAKAQVYPSAGSISISVQLDEASTGDYDAYAIVNYSGGGDGLVSPGNTNQSISVTAYNPLSGSYITITIPSGTTFGHDVYVGQISLEDFSGNASYTESATTDPVELIYPNNFPNPGYSTVSIAQQITINITSD